jgi:hypothetical protein
VDVVNYCLFQLVILAPQMVLLNKILVIKN